MPARLFVQAVMACLPSPVRQKLMHGMLAVSSAFGSLMTGVIVPFCGAAFQRVCSQRNLAALGGRAQHIYSSVMQQCPGVMPALQSWSHGFQSQLQQRLPQLSSAAFSAVQFCRLQFLSRILGQQVSQYSAYCTLSPSGCC